MIFGNLAAFVFYTEPFELWFITGEEGNLINDYNSAELAMEDVEGHRAFLNSEYGKIEPDINVSRQISEYWMEME